MTDRPMTEAEQMLAETEMIALAASHGFQISVDPDIADHMGAFSETALDDIDADESRFDVDLDTGLVLADLDDAGDKEMVQ